MRTVLITRAKEQAQEFAAQLANFGLVPVFFPTIDILEPESWDAVDEEIRRIAGYTDLIFTSANGVRFFIERCETLCAVSHLAEKICHVVGAKTKTVLEGREFKLAPLPDKFNAEQLAAQIVRDATAREKRFLFPCGSLSDESLVKILTQHHLEITAVIVYRTVRPEIGAADKDAIWAMLVKGEIPIVTFFSPSSVKNFVETFPELTTLKHVTIAVIGQTTAKACRELGLNPAIVPQEPLCETPGAALARLIAAAVEKS